MKCKHTRAYGDWSHTDYIVWCPDCQKELNTKEVAKLTEKTVEKLVNKFQPK